MSLKGCILFSIMFRINLSEVSPEPVTYLQELQPLSDFNAAENMALQIAGVLDNIEEFSCMGHRNFTLIISYLYITIAISHND
jgi:hypothetical protein